MLCAVSCRPPGAPDDPCRPLASPGSASRILLPPCSSCDAAAGYCDVRPVWVLQGAGAAGHRTQAALHRRGPCRPPLLAAVQVVGGAGGGGRPGGGAVGDGALFCRPHAVLQPPAAPGRALGDTTRRPLSALGLPAASQMRCCRRPVAAVSSSQQQSAEPQPSVSPPLAPSVLVASDADAWPDSSSLEHLPQTAPPGGGPVAAPLAQVAV